MFRVLFRPRDLQGFMVGFQPCELGLEEGEFLFLCRIALNCYQKNSQPIKQVTICLNNSQYRYEHQKVCDEVVEKTSEKVSVSHFGSDYWCVSVDVTALWNPGFVTALRCIQQRSQQPPELLLASPNLQHTSLGLILHLGFQDAKSVFRVFFNFEWPSSEAWIVY